MCVRLLAAWLGIDLDTVHLTPHRYSRTWYFWKAIGRQSAGTPARTATRRARDATTGRRVMLRCGEAVHVTCCTREGATAVIALIIGTKAYRL
jgi:hypothetical protein